MVLVPSPSLLHLMFYLLATSFAFWRTASSIPISTIDAGPPSLDHPYSRRTEWDIIRSCFAVIFTCAWVAIHPNVPCPPPRDDLPFWEKKRHWLRNFINGRLLIFVVTLLVPEFVLSWAIRQRKAARTFVKESKEEYGYNCTCF